MCERVCERVCECVCECVRECETEIEHLFLFPGASPMSSGRGKDETGINSLGVVWTKLGYIGDSYIKRVYMVYHPPPPLTS